MYHVCHFATSINYGLIYAEPFVDFLVYVN